MKLHDLRETIPALESGVYLNWGAGGPSPRRVVAAAEAALEHQAYEAPMREGMYTASSDVFDRTRSVVAGFVGAAPNEIALTNSTTDGINRVAGSFDWDDGDVVVRSDLEHPSGILPWRRLERERGIEVCVLESEGGHVDVDDVLEATTDSTLVCVSSLCWTHGTRLPIPEIVEIAHDAGAIVLVDAVQSVGQEPVDVDEWGADFVVGAGHKWLLAPFGSGFLYVRDGVERDRVPAAIGYRSVEEETAHEYRYRSGARRFEIGTSSPAPHAGLTEAISTIDEVGIDVVQRRVEKLTDRLKDGIPSDELRSPRPYESGLVTIAADDPPATVDRLAGSGIVVRALPFPRAIRASVHAFNTRADVDALLEAL